MVLRDMVERAQKDEIGKTVKSIYDKLSGIEPAVSRAMVQETAKRMRAIIEKMGSPRRELLPGYRAKILDGNHLRRTDRRIGELREINGAPLPGQALVVLDPQLMMVSDVIPCEDGHAQERSLLPQILETVQRGEVWIADRNYADSNGPRADRHRQAHSPQPVRQEPLASQEKSRQENEQEKPTSCFHRAYPKETNSALKRRTMLAINGCALAVAMPSRFSTLTYPPDGRLLGDSCHMYQLVQHLVEVQSYRSMRWGCGDKLLHSPAIRSLCEKASSCSLLHDLRHRYSLLGYTEILLRQINSDTMPVVFHARHRRRAAPDERIKNCAPIGTSGKDAIDR